MGKDGYYGDFDSLEDEQRAFQDHVNKIEENQQPGIVPCYKCGSAMYQVSNVDSGNICDNCLTTPTSRSEEKSNE